MEDQKPNRSLTGNGEWTWTSSAWELGPSALNCFFGDEWLTTVCMNTSWKKNFEEGESPVCHVHVVVHGAFHWVTFLGIGAQSWWYISSAATYVYETDSKQVPWGKYEKDFEKRVKSVLKLLDIKRRKQVCLARLLHICRYVTVSWFPCCYIMHVCGVCCLACHLVLCISKMWMAWYFALCRRMLSMVHIYIAVVYGCKIRLSHTLLCAGWWVSVCWLRWQHCFLWPVLKHGPRSLTYVQVRGWANL